MVALQKSGLWFSRILGFWTEIEQSGHVIWKLRRRAFEAFDYHLHILSRLEVRWQNKLRPWKRWLQKRNGERFWQPLSNYNCWRSHFRNLGQYKNIRTKAVWFWADSFGTLKITQSLQFFLWRRVQKEGGNREKNRFGLKRSQIKVQLLFCDNI